MDAAKLLPTPGAADVSANPSTVAGAAVMAVLKYNFVHRCLFIPSVLPPRSSIGLLPPQGMITRLSAAFFHLALGSGLEIQGSSDSGQEPRKMRKLLALLDGGSRRTHKPDRHTQAGVTLRAELMHCDTTFDHGCGGGFMDFAFAYIMGNQGIHTEEDYPYGRTSWKRATANKSRFMLYHRK